jgi:hypothetical protein
MANEENRQQGKFSSPKLCQECVQAYFFASD